jgi:autotransporter passenger strand-loop-strand repeat protein
MATTIVSNGTTDTGLTIASGNTLTVQTGGTIVSGVISGTATIAGVDSGSIIELGGVETLLTGATVSGDVVYGLQQIVSANASTLVSINNETIESGGVVDIFYKNNTIENSTILTGGLLAISGNATGYDLTLAGGTIALESPSSNITGTLNFEAGTLVESKVISSGSGDLATIEGFNANDTIELTAAVVGTGAAVTSGTTSSDTVLTITSGSTVETFTFAGTSLSFEASTISGGGELITLGTSTTTTTSSGTTVTVASGVTSANVTVASGNVLDVLAGGTVTAPVVLSGGTAIILGTDDDAVVSSGGTLIVSSGALENGATILAGGTEVLVGIVSTSSVASGGNVISGGQIYGLQEIVSANATTGTTITNETIFSGGAVEILFKTNTIESSTLLNGGQLVINGNATGENLTLEGGTINLDSGKANLAGTLDFVSGTLLESSVISSGYGDLATITGFNAADTIELTAFTTGATLASTASGGNTTLTVTSGTVAESFTFAGTDYQFGLGTISGGGEEITLTPTVTVTGSQTLVNSTFGAGYTLDVLAAGSVSAPDILSGGAALIYGTVSGADIALGGSEIVYGTTSNDLVYGSAVVSGTQSGATIEAGGSETLSGTASDVTLNGGALTLAEADATITGGLSFAAASTLVEDVVVATGYGVGGEIAGFGSGDVIDLTAIGTGATLTSAVQGSDMVVTIAGGSNMSGAVEIFTFSGDANDLFELGSITGGDSLVAVNPVISVSSGTSTAEIVSAGYQLTVASGATVTGASILSGGSASIYGTDSGSTIALGGTETVFSTGSASNDVISGTQLVSGTVADETIASGGSVSIAAGASASNLVLSGGVLNLGSADLSGGITFAAGGTLEQSAIFSDGAVISGFTSGDVIDLTNIGTGAIITGLETINGNEVMTISGGSSMGTLSETITFAGTGEYYELAADSSGTGETLTAIAQLTSFTAGDIVVGVVGDDNDSADYGDNQAAPIVLEEIDPTTGKIIGEMVLPQTITTLANGTVEYAISGEYGSSSEGILQLSGNGESLVIAGYGVNAATYNTAEETGGVNTYGTAALAQTTSVEGGTVTAVARVIADISYDGSVDTSTALYDVFNENNPRSVTTEDGSVFYISGQGVTGDTTQGVFVAEDGADSATAIDTVTDTRDIELYDGNIYVSENSKQDGGVGTVEEFSGEPTGTATPTDLSGIDFSVLLTAATANGVNNSAIGTKVDLSPEQYFFANATTLYIADGGDPKNGTLGDGGLQKWVLDTTTGQWNLVYTLSDGLNLVENTATAGTSGLIGLTGVLNADGTVTFYATNETIGDLDQTYVYTITDEVSATTLPTSETFSVVTTASADTNVRGVSLAPSTPTDVTVSASQTSAGLTVSTGATLTVQAGGVISGAVVSSGGTAVVSGTDSGSLIVGSGTEIVYGSATGDNVYGVQTVSGSVSSETVYYGAILQVANGGTATAITTAYDGLVEDAGTVSGITMSGGILTLADGASVSGITLAGTAEIDELTADVTIAGVISGFAVGDEIDLVTIGSGATLTSSVAGGDTVETVTTSGGVSQSFTLAGEYAPGIIGLESDGSGGEILAILPSTVSGTEEVTDGEYGTLITIANGGVLQVDAGATVTEDLVQSGGTAVIAGTASDDVIAGSETIASGATVSGETITGGTLAVNEGADVSGVTLDSGALVLGSSASVSGIVLEEGTLAIGSGATAGTVSGFSLGTTIDFTQMGTASVLTSVVSGSDTVETVTSGSVSQSVTLAGLYVPGAISLAADGQGGVELEFGGTTVTGTETITSGEYGAYITVATGGTLVVDGGTLVNDAIYGTESLIGANDITGDVVYGTQVVPSGITGNVLDDEIIYGSVQLLNKSNTLENSTVASGGTFLINGNATGYDLVLDGGTINLNSPKANVTGTLDFVSGTLIESGVISAGYGDEAVITGFGAGDVIALSGIGSTATLSSAVNTAGDWVESVTSGTEVETFTFAGTSSFELVTLGGVVSLTSEASVVSSGTVTGSIVSSGGEIVLQSGGTASGTTVQSGGTLVVSGGTDSGTTLSGGSEVISSGGTSIDALVTNSGTQSVGSGGTVVGATLTGDSTEILLSGAVAYDVTVGDPSVQTIASGGTAYNTTLTDDGDLAVYGTASGVIIESGSIEFVYSGGTASDSLIESGGTLVLDGGTATGTTLEAGGTIIADTLSYVSGMTGTLSGGTLEVSEGGSIVLSLQVDASDTGNVVLVSEAADGNTELTLCFYPGTRIATPDGEVAVESLRAGGLVLTANGVKPVRWMGESHVATRFADKQRTLPVRITAGALGNGLPQRDLLLSPDHAVFIDGILVQASALVNGESIFRETNVPEHFTYHHVELETHELLLAEGVQAESFVDNVDRMHFHNWDARETPATPIAELPYPRAKSARQLPAALRQALAVVKRA